MKIIQVLFLILSWVLPILLFAKTFKNREEQQDLKNDMKSPLFIISSSFGCIGVLLYFSGFIVTIKLLQHIGAILVILAWMAICMAMWRKSVTTSVVLMSFGLIGVYIYQLLL